MLILVLAIMLTDTLYPIPLDATWIPRALLLSDEAGWNQNAADWAVFFKYGTVLGFAIADRLVATAAALPYGDAFGWISMVLGNRRMAPAWSCDQAHRSLHVAPARCGAGCASGRSTGRNTPSTQHSASCRSVRWSDGKDTVAGA